MSVSPGRTLPLSGSIVAALAAVYLIWGTTYFAIKVAIIELPPFVLAGTRFLAAGSLLMGWQLLRGRPWPSAREWRGAAILGFLLLVVGNGSVSVAERWISSGATVALGSVVPLATALWAGVFGQWPRRIEWGAIGLGAAGTLVMLLGHDLEASLRGSVIILIGATSWSFATVLSRRIVVPHGASGFAAELLTAGLMAVAVSVALGERWSPPHMGQVWSAWGYLVVFGSLLGFSAFRFVAERSSPTLASSYAYVNPPVALIVGAWLGHERFSVNLLVGLPTVLAAVGLLAWAHRQAAAAPEASAGTYGLARSAE